MNLDLTYGQGWMQHQYQCFAPFVGVDVERRKTPDVLASFVSSPFRAESFDVVLFDPPFIPWRGPPSFVRDWGFFPNIAVMRKALYKAWREIDRVLKPGGLVIFKWGTTGKEVSFPLKLRPSSLSVIDFRKERGKGSSGRDQTRKDKATYFVVLRKHELVSVSPTVPGQSGSALIEEQPRRKAEQMMTEEICVDLTWGRGWTTKEVGYNPTVTCDIRPECNPSIVLDWTRALPFPDSFADEIVFDPPFSCRGSRVTIAKTSYAGSFVSTLDMVEKLRFVFSEIRRVLTPDGHCLFKWGGDRLTFERVLALTEMNCVFSMTRNSVGGSKTRLVRWFVLERREEVFSDSPTVPDQSGSALIEEQPRRAVRPKTFVEQWVK